MTIVGAGGKFDNKAYKSSAGLHGMGAKAVTALSEIDRGRGPPQRPALPDGVRPRHRRPAAGGHRRRPPTPGPRSPSGRTRRSSATSTFDFDTLENRLRELAFLNRGLAITPQGRADRQGGDAFSYEGGVAEYVTWLNRNEDALHPPIHILGPSSTPTGTATGPDQGRGRLPVHDRRRRAGPLLRQQPVQPERRHPPDRVPQGPDPAPSTPTPRRTACTRTTSSRAARTSARA